MASPPSETPREAIRRNVLVGSWICVALASALWVAGIVATPSEQYGLKMLRAGGLLVPAGGLMLAGASLYFGTGRQRRASVASAALNGVFCAYWLLMVE